MSVSFGFAKPKQLLYYMQFCTKVLSLLASELLEVKYGYPVKGHQWEKRLLKAFKALAVMEQYKNNEPHFTQPLTTLIEHIKKIRREQGETISEFSNNSSVRKISAVKGWRE